MEQQCQLQCLSEKFTYFQFEADVLRVATQKGQSALKTDTGCSFLSLVGCLLLRTVSPHRKQLKKEADTQKKKKML